jgi:hypothetical protein
MSRARSVRPESPTRLFILDEFKTSIACLHEELEHRPQRHDPLLSILRIVLSVPLPTPPRQGPDCQGCHSDARPKTLGAPHQQI